MNPIYFLIELVGGLIYPHVSRGSWENQDLHLMKADTRVKGWRRVGEYEYIKFIEEHPERLHPKYKTTHAEALGSK